MTTKMISMLIKALKESDRTSIDFANEDDVAFVTPLLKKAINNSTKGETEKLPKAKNSYMEFCKEVRSTTDFSEIKDPKDISRRLGQMWRDLSDEQKEVYKKRAAENKEKYNEAKPRATSPSEAKKEEKEVKPKRPLSAYIKFCGANRSEVAKTEKTPQDVSRRLGEMWKALSDDEKQMWKAEVPKEAEGGEDVKKEEVVEKPKKEKKEKK